MSNKRSGFEFLLKVAATIQKELELAGIKPQDARQAALKAVEVIRHENGGNEVYIPKGMALTLSHRDWKIWNEFDGTNYSALSRKHKLTVRQIRRIIGRCREEERIQGVAKIAP